MCIFNIHFKLNILSYSPNSLSWINWYIMKGKHHSTSPQHRINNTCHVTQEIRINNVDCPISSCILTLFYLKKCVILPFLSHQDISYFTCTYLSYFYPVLLAGNIMVWCIVFLCDIISLEMFDSAEDFGVIK